MGYFRDSKGITLIELLLVSTIMGILFSIAIVVYNKILSNVKKDVDVILIKQIERDYENYLTIYDTTHSDETFLNFMSLYYQEYLDKVTYVDGSVYHKELEPIETEEVPFLKINIGCFIRREYGERIKRL